MKKIALIILACLLAASLLAFVANYLIYTPMLEHYSAQIDEQYSEITRLAGLNNDIKQTLATHEYTISSQQAQIASLQDELEKAEAAISDLEAELLECEMKSK